MLRFEGSQGTSFYTYGGGWMNLSSGSPSSDHSYQVGYVTPSGSVYEGSQSSDYANQLGYVTSSGDIYKGSPSSDYSYQIGYTAVGGGVYKGSRSSDYTLKIGRVIGGSSEDTLEEIYHFGGACLLLQQVAEEKEKRRCPKCGSYITQWDGSSFGDIYHKCIMCGYRFKEKMF